jgi:hypothetical protein
MDIGTKQLSSQRFWEIMDRLSYEAIVSFERDITVQMVRDFGIDLRQILFDGTNFLTFIDTFNDRFTLAQRGKNKEGRKALRIVKLALMLSSLLQRELCRKGINRSIPDLLDELGKIQEVGIVYPPQGKKKCLLLK